MQEACSSQPNAVSVNIQHRTRGNLWLYCPTIERKIRPRSNVSHNATRATMISPTQATEPLRHHRGISSDRRRGDRPVAPTDFVRRRVSDTGPQCQSAKSAPLCGQPQGLPLQIQTQAPRSKYNGGNPRASANEDPVPSGTAVYPSPIIPPRVDPPLPVFRRPSTVRAYRIPIWTCRPSGPRVRRRRAPQAGCRASSRCWNSPGP